MPASQLRRRRDPVVSDGPQVNWGLDPIIGCP